MVLNALWSMTLHVILNRAEMALCGPILCHDGLVGSNIYIVPRWPCVVLYFAESERVQCGLAYCSEDQVLSRIILREPSVVLYCATTTRVLYYGASLC